MQHKPFSHLVSFHLPSGGSGIPAGIKRTEIQSALAEWSYRWRIHPTLSKNASQLSLHCYFNTIDDFAVFKLTFVDKYAYTVMTPNEVGVYVNYDKC
jgi:hypothetical protein